MKKDIEARPIGWGAQCVPGPTSIEEVQAAARDQITKGVIGSTVGIERHIQTRAAESFIPARPSIVINHPLTGKPIEICIDESVIR